MKYLTVVGTIHVPKSKAEKNIQEFLLQNDRKLLDAASVEIFKEKVLSHINFIYQENRRCKPRVTYWFKFGDLTRDFGLSGIDSVIFSLFEIKGIAEVSIDKKQDNGQ